MTTAPTPATLPATPPADLAPEPGPAAERSSLIGLERAELAALADGLGEPAFRARQLYQWIYFRGERDFDAMTNLGKPLRARLAERFTLDRPEVASRQVSADGTRKWLLRFADGNEAECVYIPEPERGTLCISSQVGCTLTCRFCHTGTQRMVRNLTAGEIAAQVLLARDELEDWARGTENRRLTNIVLMGMGEPLYNTDNVIRAMRIASDGEGLGVSRRRITLSTSGVVPEIARVGAELGAGLAISLHATTDELRDVLVPINRKYPLAELLDAVRAYPGLGNAKRVTWEYVMLKDVNDSPADAKRLVELIRGIPSKINLIPFNPWPGAPYECSDAAAIERFAAVVEKAGYMSPVRTPRGRDIMAACGQLKSASERRRKVRAAAGA